MKIVVKLFATLRDFGPKYQEKEVKEPYSLGNLIDELGIPENYPMIMLVNGEFSCREYLLKDGDVVALFPPIAGG